MSTTAGVSNSSAALRQALSQRVVVADGAMGTMLQAADRQMLRDAMETLANDCSGLEDRARYLVRAAEIDVVRLDGVPGETSTVSVERRDL